MPDQDPRLEPGWTLLSEEVGDEVRCSICPGLAGVTFQADCVCCGRPVPATACTQPDHSKAGDVDLAKSVSALSSKSGACPSSSREPVNNPASRRRGRQRRLHIPLLRRAGDGEGSNEGLLCFRSAPFRVNQKPRPLAPRRRRTKGGARKEANGDAHPAFKGVRTREGVKGFLVEIRPPKWKRTIWLGTYNTLVEAAGAYDAGVFYTKKSDYNFRHSSGEGMFPPLPPHLNLDNPDSIDEFKLFVQHQAKVAAHRIGSTAMGTTATPPPAPQGEVHDQPASIVEEPVDAASASPDANSLMHEPTSSESCIIDIDDDPWTSSTCMDSSSEHEVVEIESAFHMIPMDLDYLRQCLQAETAEEAARTMFLDYTNYFSQQAAAALDRQPLCEEEEDDQFSILTS